MSSKIHALKSGFPSAQLEVGLSKPLEPEGSEWFALLMDS